MKTVAQTLVFNHGFCILTRSFYFIVPLKDEVYIPFSYFPCNGFDICGMLTNGSTRSWSRTALSFRGACFLSIHPLVLKIGLHLALKRIHLHLALKRIHLLCFRDLLYTLYDEEDISKYYAGDLISKFFTFRKRRGLSIFFPYSHR